MTIAQLFTDLGILSLFLLAGLALREIIKPLQKLFIPASMVGGLLALVCGPQVMNWVAIPKSYGQLSGTLINLILTCLVFGVTINKKRLANYIDYCCLATGLKGAQLAIGAALGLVMTYVWTDLPAVWGTMGVFSFLGGHGNATAVGKIEHCSSLNEVKAIAHSSYNSYAGGIAALNDNGSLISSSRQTAFVCAESPDPVYDFAGGIVGNNCGGVQTSFFLGTLAERDDSSFVGALCGITYLYETIYLNGYVARDVDLLNNAYVKDDNYAYGGLKFVNRTDAPSYTATILEREDVEEWLDLRAIAVASFDELKALEIYYE